MNCKFKKIFDKTRNYQKSTAYEKAYLLVVMSLLGNRFFEIHILRDKMERDLRMLTFIYYLSQSFNQL